jgi:hypothetical protein
LSFTDPYGSSESSRIDGTATSSFVSWDSKITTVNAVLGGVSQFVETKMRNEGLYDEFISIVQVCRRTIPFSLVVISASLSDSNGQFYQKRSRRVFSYFSNCLYSTPKHNIYCRPHNSNHHPPAARIRCRLYHDQGRRYPVLPSRNYDSQ